MTLRRLLTLALAFVAVLFASVALAGGTPTFTIDSPTAEAGKAITFTITRVSGDRGGYVLFKTADGSAKAGVDYQATERLVYVRAGADVITVPVPTFANPAATGPLTFTAAIASTNVGLAGTATITQPPPPPPGSWVPAPLAVGGYAFVGANQGQTCCKGLIVKVLDVTWDAPDPEGTKHFRAHPVFPLGLWKIAYFNDANGNVAPQYQSAIIWMGGDNLTGVAPAGS